MLHQVTGTMRLQEVASLSCNDHINTVPGRKISPGLQNNQRGGAGTKTEVVRFVLLQEFWRTNAGMLVQKKTKQEGWTWDENSKHIGNNKWQNLRPPWRIFRAGYETHHHYEIKSGFHLSSSKHVCPDLSHVENESALQSKWQKSRLHQ